MIFFTIDLRHYYLDKYISGRFYHIPDNLRVKTGINFLLIQNKFIFPYFVGKVNGAYYTREQNIIFLIIDEYHNNLDKYIPGSYKYIS